MRKRTTGKLRRILSAALFTILFAGMAPVSVKAESFSAANYTVLGNIIGGVESGGQVYGGKNYSAYAGAHTNSDLEVTCTLGWAQYYGSEAQRLIQNIYSRNPSAFRKIDSEGLIQEKLNDNWVGDAWDPNEEEKDVLIRLISSEEGRAAQDEMFTEVVRPMVAECEATYTKNAQAVAMYVEIRHLGGKTPVDRIFKRCGGNYSVDNILASLKKDQEDTSNNNQVGDALYWSRHEKCGQWVKKYISGSGTSDSSSQTTVSASSATVSVYRLYQKSTGEHFYTAGSKEMQYLRSHGWTYEGIAWKAPVKSSSPVYRVYNPNSGEHFYTASSKERAYLIKAGWKDEGIGWYSDTEKAVPVYRAFNPNASIGAHNYTISQKEQNYLAASGWKNEGVAWYGAA